MPVARAVRSQISWTAASGHAGCACQELTLLRRPGGAVVRMPGTVPPSLLIVLQVLRPCFTASAAVVARSAPEGEAVTVGKEIP